MPGIIELFDVAFRARLRIAEELICAKSFPGP